MAPNWKLDLYHRDNYCCQKCGKTVDLGVHHMFAQSSHEILKRNRANLITLCNSCHQHFHNIYCKRDIKKSTPLSFLEWMGEDFIKNNFKTEPKYLVKIDKRYKDTFNRIWKDDEDEDIVPSVPIHWKGTCEIRKLFDK